MRGITNVLQAKVDESRMRKHFHVQITQARNPNLSSFEHIDFTQRIQR
jgi:hypothetical protein